MDCIPSFKLIPCKLHSSERAFVAVKAALFNLFSLDMKMSFVHAKIDYLLPVEAKGLV